MSGRFPRADWYEGELTQRHGSTICICRSEALVMLIRTVGRRGARQPGRVKFTSYIEKQLEMASCVGQKYKTHVVLNLTLW